MNKNITIVASGGGTACGNNSDQKLTKWISVKDRLPAPYEMVLIFLPEETMPIKICQFNDYDLMERLGITHWMKLPEKPSDT